MWGRRLLWLAMTVLCLVFAPMAAEFYWVNESGGLATYARVLSVAVSESYALGAGSGIEVMTPHWRAMPDALQVVLGVHAFLASVALCIGPFLFVERLRVARPGLHRRLGQVYVGLVVVAMVLSMVYLAFTPFEKIYGGAPFAVGLWGIAVLTLYTAVVGTWHILRGEREAHRSVMILNFSAMLIAPMLRLWWGILGVVFEGATQAETHVVALMILGVQTFIGAIVVVHVTRRQVSVPSSIQVVGAWFSSRIDAMVVGAWALGLAAVGHAVSRLAAHGLPGWGSEPATASLIAEQLVYAAHPGCFVLETGALVGLFLVIPSVVGSLYGRGDTPVASLYLIVGLAVTVAGPGSPRGCCSGPLGVPRGEGRLSAWCSRPRC